ncbi:MAG: hypothetical protein ACLR0U_09350 [Enterocloster clostridioformis]
MPVTADSLHRGQHLRLQCASRAGVDSCLALWGCHCPDDISSTHRFEDPAAIIRWLE